jgi:hypothetical protein
MSESQHPICRTLFDDDVRSLPAYRSEGKAIARPPDKLQHRIAGRRRARSLTAKARPSDHQTYRDARGRRTMSERFEYQILHGHEVAFYACRPRVPYRHIMRMLLTHPDPCDLSLWVGAGTCSSLR